MSPLCMESWCLRKVPRERNDRAHKRHCRDILGTGALDIVIPAYFSHRPAGRQRHAQDGAAEVLPPSPVARTGRPEEVADVL